MADFSVDYSLHTHTLGFDGRNTVEEMVLAARSRGIKTLGFSNHFILHPAVKKSPMYKYAERGGYSVIYSDNLDDLIARFSAHYATVRNLREKYSDMRLLCGMEMDWFKYADWGDMIGYAVRKLKPDYIIGAMHFIDRGEHGILNVHDIEKAGCIDSRRLLREYYQNIGEMCEYNWRGVGFDFNFFAHFDLPRKLGLRAPDMEKYAIQTLVQHGFTIELNSSLMMGARYDNVRESLHNIACANAPVVFSDDTHGANQIGYKTNDLAYLAHDAGVRRICMRAMDLDKFIGR